MNYYHQYDEMILFLSQNWFGNYCDFRNGPGIERAVNGR